jgi:hypothetical protein
LTFLRNADGRPAIVAPLLLVSTVFATSSIAQPAVEQQKVVAASYTDLLEKAGAPCGMQELWRPSGRRERRSVRSS